MPGGLPTEKPPMHARARLVLGRPGWHANGNHPRGARGGASSRVSVDRRELQMALDGAVPSERWGCVMRTLWMTALGLMWLGTSASAQVVATFADLPLRLNIGERVTVEDRSGAAVKGTVQRLTSEEIVVTTTGGERVFTRASVSRIQRRGDSLRNGMLIGAVLGGALGGAFAGSFSGEFRASDFLQGVAIFGGVGLGLGLAVDAAHAGSTTVFAARSASAERSGRHDGRRIALNVTRRW